MGKFSQMPSNRGPRAALTAIALAVATLLASCSTPPPPPPVVAAPPAPPPITLSSSVIERASAFRGYMQRAGAISPDFQNGEQIQAALRVGAGYEPKSFLSGLTSYAAVLALQDPTFVASARAFAADPAQRRQVIAQIIADPAYVVAFKGSDSAAGLIIDTLGADGLTVLKAGKRVKQAAYDVQHANWSKASVLDRDGRLAAAKSNSAAPALADIADVAVLQQASIGAQSLGLPTRSAEAPYRPLVIRGMAVAALAALGAAGDNDLPTIDAIMADPTAASCLNMSKLNLYQCLAVAKPHYEDVFCLGQHILIDTGACMVKWSGATMPPEPIRVPVVAPSTPKKKTAAATPAKKPAISR